MTPRRRVVLTAVTAVGLLAALTGCFPAPPSEAGRATPGTLHPIIALHDPKVLKYCPPRTPEHLDGVVAPTERVYICRGGVRFDSDGVSTYGPWEVAYSVTDPAALVDAYRQQNAPVQGICPAVLADPLLIWVHRGAEIRSFYAPVGPCGSPSRAAANAYRTATIEIVDGVDTGQPGYRSGKE